MYIWSDDLQQGCQDYSMGKECSQQEMEKLDIHMEKNEIRALSYKNSKMD